MRDVCVLCYNSHTLWFSILCHFLYSSFWCLEYRFLYRKFGNYSTGSRHFLTESISSLYAFKKWVTICVISTYISKLNQGSFSSMTFPSSSSRLVKLAPCFWYGVKTLRTQDTSDPRHFGTSAEVSIRHFGQCRTVRTFRHYGRHFGTGRNVLYTLDGEKVDGYDLANFS